jgi:hypothetical protein
MYSMTYDLWNTIIDEAVDSYAPFFETMQNVSDSVLLSRSLVEELKLKGAKEVARDDRQFLLTIEPYDDEIGGFKISLLATGRVDAFEAIVEKAAASHKISFENIRNFEIEHGLNMADEILDKIKDEFSIYAERSDHDLIFELVVFDSEDIDNSNRMSGRAWEGQ